MSQLAAMLVACSGDPIPFNIPPELTVSEAKDIYRKGATISGTFTKANDEVFIETFGLYYGLNNHLYSADSVLATSADLNATTGSYTITLENLSPATTYYYATFASSGYSIAKSEVKSFTTSSEASAILSAVSAYTTDENNVLFVSAYVEEEGLVPISEFGFVYSTDTQTPTIEANRSISATGNKEQFTAKLTELIPSMTNYIRAYSKSSDGIGYGRTFTYNASDFPVLTTQAAYDIQPYQASLSSAIDIRSSSISECGFLWSDSNNVPSFEDNMKVATSGSSISTTLTGLNDNVLYYYRPYARHAKGVSYGAVMQFSTLVVQQAELSEVTVSDVTSYSALFEASVTNLKNGTLTDAGFVYSASPNPTIDDFRLSLGAVTFLSAQCSSLSEFSSYYVRAYATNEKGTSYGEQTTFRTNKKVFIDHEGYDDVIDLDK